MLKWHRQKPPHSQSDFVVFQKLTQQVTKMIQSEPLVSLQTVLVRVERL